LTSTRYQFNPDLYNPDVVINILIKALLASPLPDFNLCISLLDDRPQNPTLDEPDPLPSLLPVLKELYALLQQCKFPAFWALFHSETLDSLRDNYTVECLGFEDAIRDVATRAVQTTFTRIGVDRFASYLNLTGTSIDIDPGMNYSPSREGSDLEEFVSKLGWSLRSGVVEIPPNPDNQIESTVVQENIKLPRMPSVKPGAFDTNMTVSELVKIISHSAQSV
jgi:translation initiation factor 3 subunit K